MRILVAEDDAILAEAVQRSLRQSGHAVDWVQNGAQAEDAVQVDSFDLLILDLGLPKKSGLDVLKRLRLRDSRLPVLILTAAGGITDRVRGLDAGADDYLAKPFHFEELLARMQALLRRSGGWAQPVLRCGAVALDPRTQEVTVNGRRVDLTSFEYRILEYLIHRAGEVISKGELTERLYAQDFDRDSNTIEVFIGRLRRKLDPDDSIKPIETLRGRGYRFALQRESAA
jgi:two-component system, OmpR family, response regulator PhoP